MALGAQPLDLGLHAPGHLRGLPFAALRRAQPLQQSRVVPRGVPGHLHQADPESWSGPHVEDERGRRAAAFGDAVGDGGVEESGVGERLHERGHHLRTTPRGRLPAIAFGERLPEGAGAHAAIAAEVDGVDLPHPRDDVAQGEAFRRVCRLHGDVVEALERRQGVQGAAYRGHVERLARTRVDERQHGRIRQIVAIGHDDDRCDGSVEQRVDGRLGGRRRRGAGHGHQERDHVERAHQNTCRTRTSRA